jgi:hypothetical protein
VKVYGVSRQHLESIAGYRGIKLARVREHSNSIDFVLRPKGTQWWRYRKKEEGRLVNAVCWHGHRDFMNEVFRQFPYAKIVSATATFKSRSDFNERVDSTPKWSNQVCVNCKA